MHTLLTTQSGLGGVAAWCNQIMYHIKDVDLLV